MKESEYQGKLIKKIKKDIPNCLVLKNDSSYLQGVPDLSVFSGPKAALLEVKISKTADHQPNQDYYVNTTNKNGGFARFIFPENEKEVLADLKNYFNK